MTYLVELPGYKHPEDVDWRHVDFSAVLGEDTVTSIDLASTGVDIVDQEFTSAGMVSVKLSGGEVSSPTPAVIQIVVHTALDGTDRALGADVHLYIRR